MMRIEEVLYRIVVRRSCNHNEVGILVGSSTIEGGSEIQFLFCKVFLNVIILNRRDSFVDFLNLFGDYINGCHLVVLGEQGGNAHAYIYSCHLMLLRKQSGNG